MSKQTNKAPDTEHARCRKRYPSRRVAVIVKMTKMGTSYLGEVEIGVKRSQIGK